MNLKINHIRKIESRTKILIFILMLSFSFILLPQFAAAEDWTMFRHDLEHTGETSDVIKSPGDLELKWKFQTGGEVHSSPAVSGTYLYVGSYDGYVYCLNKNTGELKWKFETGRGVWSSPAVFGDYLYAGSYDNYTYCLDKNTGDLKWKFQTGWEVHSSPAVSGDYVYIGSLDNNVYCLNKNTGELKWKFTAERAVSSSPAVSGGYVYIGSWDNYVYCLNKDTGDLKWKFKAGWAVSSSQAVSGDYIYAGSEDGYVYCLNKNTGELKWKFKAEQGFWSSPAVSGNHIYAGSQEGYVYCLDKDTGKLIWKFETGGMYSSPAVSGDYVYVGSYGEYFYCLDKNTGKLTWKFKAGGSVNPSPAISGDYVYIGSVDSYVYAFTEKLKPCPHECCVNLEGYTNKTCSSDDYDCRDNKCVSKEQGPACSGDSDCLSNQYCSCKCPENTMNTEAGCVMTIDNMESTVGWNTYMGDGAQINIMTVPGKFSNAIKMEYNLNDKGWVVISKNIDPKILSGTEGIRFYYKGTGEPNTIEFKLLYADENYNTKATFAFLKNKATVNGEWTSEEVLLNKFKCVSPPEICKSDSTPDISKIRKIEIAVSKQQGDAGGPGTLIIDDIYGMASESCDNGGVCLAKKPINASCSKDSECESGNCSGGLCKEQENTDLIWFLIIGGAILLVIGILIYFVRKINKKKEIKHEPVIAPDNKKIEEKPEQESETTHSPEISEEVSEDLEESLEESKSKGDIERACLYCGQLVINASESRNTVETLNWIRELKKYAEDEDYEDIKNIINELLHNLKNNREINDELIKKIKIVVHHIQMK